MLQQQLHAVQIEVLKLTQLHDRHVERTGQINAEVADIDAKRSALARPMPCVPPVTTATLPDSERRSCMVFVGIIANLLLSETGANGRFLWLHK